MPILINYDLFKTKDNVLKTRIERAQTIDRLLCEFEAINIKIAKGEANQDDIDRSDAIANKYLVNATEAFRLHMEGSGSLVRAYQESHPRIIQTIALDFLRTIQMVKPYKA
jgi:hypothetical protein